MQMSEKCFLWGKAAFTVDTDIPLLQSQWWVWGKKSNTLKFVCFVCMLKINFEEIKQCGAAIHS